LGVSVERSKRTKRDTRVRYTAFLRTSAPSRRGDMSLSRPRPPQPSNGSCLRTSLTLRLRTCIQSQLSPDFSYTSSPDVYSISVVSGLLLHFVPRRVSIAVVSGLLLHFVSGRVFNSSCLRTSLTLRLQTCIQCQLSPDFSYTSSPDVYSIAVVSGLLLHFVSGLYSIAVVSGLLLHFVYRLVFNGSCLRTSLTLRLAKRLRSPPR
jgi:hypothetical protein